MAGRRLSPPWKCPTCGKVTRFAFRLLDSRDVQFRQCQGWKNRDDFVPCLRGVHISLNQDGTVLVTD